MLVPPEYLVSLDDLAPSDSRFTDLCTKRFLTFSRWFKENSSEPRWSLVECGLQSKDWSNLLQWAHQCSAEHVPSPQSLEAGILLLAVSTAVARNRENDVLWAPVASHCSSALKQSWFGYAEYPISECRESLRDACHILALRNQLHLRGKMHYWRTVMLQFGFNSQVAQHQLPTWLAGYVVPETVRTLLNPEEENSSVTFQQFWAALGKAALNSTTTEVEFQLIHSPWCPEESRTLFLASLQQTRLSKPASSSGRIEDEDRNPTLFGLPRLGDSEFTLPLSRNLPKELTTADAQRLTLAMQGLPLTFIVGDAEGHLVFDGGPLRVSIRDVLKQPEREVKIILPHVGLYKERFAFWDDSEDVILFAGTHTRQALP